MPRNAVELFEFNEENFRLREVFHSAKCHADSCARVVADGLLAGASQDYIDGAMVAYVEAKAAKDLAFQEYKSFSRLFFFPDSE